MGRRDALNHANGRPALESRTAEDGTKAIFICTIVTSVLASCIAKADETCADVYANSLADISVKVRTAAEYDYIWNKHCEINGEVRAESAQTDLTAAVKIFKVGFSGSKQEAFQQMQQFCKQHIQEHQGESKSYDFDRNIVVAAQRSFNECRALEIAGLHVSHSVQYPRSVIIRVDFDPSRTKVNFRGVTYDKDSATCSSTGLSTDGKPVAINSETPEVVMNKPFSVVCDRIAKPVAAGESRVDRFVAGLDTNHGTYTVILPVEGMLGFDLAQENKKRYEAMLAIQQALITDRDTLSKQIDGLNGEVHLFWMGEGKEVPCPDSGGNPHAYAKAICKGSKYTLQPMVTGLSGKHCGFDQFAAVCINLGK